MAAYLEGWGQADFGVFNNIADKVSKVPDRIARGQRRQGMNIASIMLGSQDDIAKQSMRYINSVRCHRIRSIA